MSCATTNTAFDRRQAIRDIDDAWSTLSHALDCTGKASGLIEMTREESAQHDSFRRHTNIKRGITISTESKYFAVRRVIEALTQPNATPKVADFLHIQTSCFYGAALAAEFANILRPMYERERDLFDRVTNLDYPTLIRD